MASGSSGDGPGKGDLPPLAADWEAFRTEGHKLVDWLADYYKRVGELPVTPKVEPGWLRPLLPSECPETPEEFDRVLEDVDKIVVPGTTHWQHPRFFAYFSANSSPAGLLGSMLSHGFNTIGFSWVGSPIATELETVALDWLAKLVGLPTGFLSDGTGGGIIQGTASEATLVAVLAARSRFLKHRVDERRFGSEAVAAGEVGKSGESKELERDLDVELDACAAKLVGYASVEAHSSVEKAFMVAGIPRSRFRAIPTIPGTHGKMDPAALEAQIEEDKAAGLLPFVCTATLGTTSIGAFDPLRPVGEVCKRHGLWMHVDAAWAGAALVCPEFRDVMDGLELADSFDFNPHKWLLVNFNCSSMYVQERRWLRLALSLTPEYLRTKEHESGLVTDLRDWQVPLGRSFLSMKLWMVLRTVGAEGLRTHIRKSVREASLWEEWVKEEPRLVLPLPRSLSLVCFRISPHFRRALAAAASGEPVSTADPTPEELEQCDKDTEALLAAINHEGVTHMIHTKYQGRYTIRMSTGNPATTDEHMAIAWKSLLRALDDLAKTG